MTITIVSDCLDANAAGRQTARISSLLNCPSYFIGVSNSLEAAGNLIDALDAMREGAVLVNIAPRNGRAKKRKNGSPFGYFWYGDILVAATVDGLTLSLVKKLEITNSVEFLDVEKNVEEMVSNKFLEEEFKGQIVNTQFRSYHFLPRVVACLLKGGNLTSNTFSIGGIPDAPEAVWWVDNFGNCKTTILPQEVGFNSGKFLLTKKGKMSCFSRLKEVPDNASAIIIGSSGIGEQRFLEIVKQGGSAAEQFGISSGESVF
ncbi:MAG: hypothetical protein GF370_03970 [Candidatus Nealsonbacteria bacterium]|nr:hypothetical protein [Candidatus Nealsonbacteria bacterium]